MQEVLADGHARQLQPAGLLADRDQRQVGRAAAHVADQHGVADLHQLPPGVAVRLDPGIKRGLRLLQQRDVFQPRRPRRLDGQLAGRRVERRRHRQHDFLLFQPAVGQVARQLMVPRLNQMFQVERAGFQRRDAAAAFRPLPRQHRPLAVDAGVAQPRLGRRHQPRRHEAALLPGELADGVIAVGVPRQFQAAGRHFARPRQIQIRRQERPVGHGPRPDDLRHGQVRRPAVGRLRGPGIDVGHAAVGGPQVDAHDETRSRHGLLLSRVHRSAAEPRRRRAIGCQERSLCRFAALRVA